MALTIKSNVNYTNGLLVDCLIFVPIADYIKKSYT